MIRIRGSDGAVATRKTTSKARRWHIVQGYLYLSPWLLGYLALTFGPAVASFYLSFTGYDLFSPPKFIGLKNYVYAFTTDAQFWPSLVKTFYYAGASVPLGVIGSLAVALFLNVRVRGTSFFRTLYFMPSLVPIVAAAVLWAWLLQPDWGLVNLALGYIGISGPRWFESPQWAIPSLVSLALWTSVGGTRMIIFLAALQGVPEELRDAASIDGAGPWARFRHVTIPMITPAIFFNLVLGIIGALQVFTSAFVATQGGPAYATWFYSLNIYMTAFQFFSMGYASALAWMFCILIIFLSWLQVKTSRSWVYYGGEK